MIILKKLSRNIFEKRLSKSYKMYELLRVQLDIHSLFIAPTEINKNDHIYNSIHLSNKYFLLIISELNHSQTFHHIFCN